MMLNESEQQTYVLRLWRSADGTLRILLQKSTDDKPEGFTTIEDLSYHLKSCFEIEGCSTPAPEPSPDTGADQHRSSTEQA